MQSWETGGSLGNETCCFNVAPSIRVPVSATTDNPIAQCGYTREVYSVDDVRVILDADRGWQCACSAHALNGRCIHIEKASIFRQMRGVRRDEETIELVLNPAERQNLSDAQGAADAGTVDGAMSAARVLHRSRWSSLAAAAAIATLSSAVTYLATSRAEHEQPLQHHLAEATPAPVPEAVPPLEPPPVRFINPFDATEVFEFPAGTPQSDARQAVAEFLLKRARDRQTAPRSLAQRG
jgi:hypothetical protein